MMFFRGSNKIYYSPEDCAYIAKKSSFFGKTFMLTIVCLTVLGTVYKENVISLYKSQQDESVAALKEELATLSQRMEVLSESDNQLRHAVNLPTISPEEQLFGSGGSRSSYLRNAVATDSLEDVVGLLLSKVESQEESYRRILSQHNDNQFFLASVPSIKPCDKNYSSSFGMRLHPIYGVVKHHSGVDFPMNMNSPVLSTGAGKVEYVGILGGYGKSITINHGYGYKTIYAHLSEYKVSVGQKVIRGQAIALSGNTGVSVAPHLHYEVVKDGVKVDPLKYVLDDYHQF